MLQIKKEIANIWEGKVDDYANIAHFNFVCLSKTHMGTSKIRHHALTETHWMSY